MNQPSRFTHTAMTSGRNLALRGFRNSTRHSASSTSDRHAGWSNSRGLAARTPRSTDAPATQNGPRPRAASSIKAANPATPIAFTSTSAPPPSFVNVRYMPRSVSQAWFAQYRPSVANENGSVPNEYSPEATRRAGGEVQPQV